MSLLYDLVQQYKKDGTNPNPNESIASLQARTERIKYTHFKILELLEEGLSNTLKEYTHLQTVESNEWLITHNLNKYPQVAVMEFLPESVSLMEIECDVIHESKNVTKLLFSSPITGVAYFN